MGSLIPNIWFRMTPYHPVTWHGAYALPILPLKWPIHIVFSHYSATDQDRSIKFDSRYAQMDFFTNLTFQVQKERSLWSRDLISKFWDIVTFERIELSALNFGRDIADGTLLRVDHKKITNRVWSGSRDPNSKFRDTLINFERTEISTSSLTFWRCIAEYHLLIFAVLQSTLHVVVNF